MHICVSKLTIIGSDNGLSPGRCQAIIWTDAILLLIASFGTHFSEILNEILIFSFKKMRLKVPSAKWRPFCLGLNVLISDIWLLFCVILINYVTFQCIGNFSIDVLFNCETASTSTGSTSMICIIAWWIELIIEWTRDMRFWCWGTFVYIHGFIQWAIKFDIRHPINSVYNEIVNPRKEYKISPDMIHWHHYF